MADVDEIAGQCPRRVFRFLRVQGIILVARLMGLLSQVPVDAAATEQSPTEAVHGTVTELGMRSYLFARGTDVTTEVTNRRLVLSSDNAHLVNGRFNIDRMLGMLEEALDQALNDGYQGLLATG
jgi:hypothetical protein